MVATVAMFFHIRRYSDTGPQLDTGADDWIPIDRWRSHTESGCLGTNGSRDSGGPSGCHEAEEVEAGCPAPHVGELGRRHNRPKLLEPVTEMAVQHKSHYQLGEPVAGAFEVHDQQPPTRLEDSPHFGQ